VSAASIWEIAIKARLGKIEADAAALARAIDGTGFQELPVSPHRAAGVAKLPLHHTDPFESSPAGSGLLGTPPIRHRG